MSIHPDDMPALLAKLRTKARAEYNARIPIHKLDNEHRSVFIRAINNVLSTDLALFTYAQIIDGLPTADVGWDRRLPGLWGDHPLEEHEELCPGAMEKAREVCPRWDPAMLAFDPKVVNAFQGAAPGTKMFNTHLIEMLDFRLHNGDVDAVVKWVMPKPAFEKAETWVPITPPPSIFNNPAYVDADIYPDGVADVVGYWAEDRILGGVVVFDRRTEFDNDGNPITGEPPNVYFHPCRQHTTWRVTQLLDWQEQALVDFLLAEPSQAAAMSSQTNPETPCPLPILVDDRNRTRFDPEDALTLRGIFRDIWERRPLNKDERSFVKRRPKSDLDYPESRLEMLSINQAAGIPIPEGRFKRYLDGDENLEDGPWKRTLDEYKEKFGIGKKAKLDHSSDAERMAEGEEIAAEKKDNEVEEEVVKWKGKEEEEEKEEEKEGKKEEKKEKGEQNKEVEKREGEKIEGKESEGGGKKRELSAKEV